MSDLNTLQSTFEQPAADTKKEERKEFLKGLKTDLQDKLASDPDYCKRLRSMSDSLEVVHTLGYGTDGNIIRDKSVTDKRKLDATSKIVGYEVKNIGTEPITYQTETWTQGEDGVYVATLVEKTLEPGQVAYLTRKFTAVMMARPEISFTVANGILISNISGKNNGTDALLEGFYFRFNDGTPVNADSVKRSVDEEGADGSRVVKAEYVEAFGFLNNPTKSKKKDKKDKPKVTVQDMMANYINTLISQQ